MALLLISVGSALGETKFDLIPINLDALAGAGRIIDPRIQGKLTGKRQEVAGFLNKDTALGIILDFDSRLPVTALVLQPAGNPTADGGGTNVSRDGNCFVGYHDNGPPTPFHGFRWTQATGPVDLGTLDPTNNASRSSFATDTDQDCSVVVWFSDLTANGTIQHAFRWSSAGGPTGTIVDLLTPTNGGPISRAFGVSSNGTVVVSDADFFDPNNSISGKS